MDDEKNLNNVRRLPKIFTTVMLMVFMLLHTETSDSSCNSSETYEELKQRIEEREIAKQKFLYQREYDLAYEAMIDTLKWHEGFRAYPYYCMANVRTVGYGHAIKREDSFNYPISKEFADSLMRADFDKCIAYVERSTDLEHLQKLAIAHFVYALGSGRFHNSTLREFIEQDKPIDDEIIKWINIRTTNGVVQSDHLRRSRIMELNLYNERTQT